MRTFMFLITDKVSSSGLVESFRNAGCPIVGLSYDERWTVHSETFDYPEDWNKMGLPNPLNVGLGLAFQKGWDNSDEVEWALVMKEDNTEGGPFKVLHKS